MNLACERRQYPRKEMSAPVVLHKSDSNKHFYYSGMIKDISMSGIGIEIPKEKSWRVEEETSDDEMEILFEMPGITYPFSMKCKICRVQRHNGTVRIGAFFTEEYNDFRRVFQNYLM